MSTVRIYKIAELLGTTSQEIVALFKRDHGIEVKSASSTVEEIVAHQFVARLARTRGVTLPKGDIFAEGAAAKVKKGGTARKVEPPPPPPKPSMPPPRLVKTVKVPHPVEAPVEPELEAIVEHEPIAALEVEPEPIVTEPAAAHEPAPVHAKPAPEPAEAVEPEAQAVETAPVEEAASVVEAPEAPTAPSALPRPAAGRFVPSTLRLRVEEPRKHVPLEPLARALPPRPPVRPAATGTAATPAAKSPTAPAAARPPMAARPGTATPGRPALRPPYSPRLPVTGGPRPLPSQPMRPLQPGMPGARPGAPTAPPRPAVGRPAPPHRPMGRPGGRPSRRGPGRDNSLPTAAIESTPPPVTRTITLAEGMTVKDLSDKLDIRAKEILKKLLDRRIMMTINTTLDTETATWLAREFGADVKMRTFEEDVLEVGIEDSHPEDQVTRAPVVTVMGHVDHGKTTLLDAIRETKVAEHEAGGITQHIGAYQVVVNKRPVVFLDTPGHEAFTLMRARGARVTDIVILVVAADDGVMPQTREAIDHARAAGVPIIVAINKIDKPEANQDRVMKDLADLGLMPEQWGGQTVTVPVSAKKRQNIELLLEMILLVTDIGDLKANPKAPGQGAVLEAKLDRGRGPVATVLVQNGTLRVGDTVIAGSVIGKVRALFDDRGQPVKLVGPSSPVEVLGLTALPQPGDTFQVIADQAKARQVASFRQTQAKERALGAKSSRLTLESLKQQIAEGGIKELPIVVKADVQGSAEVLADTLGKMSDEKVKVRIIHSGAGAINESDVLLASASNAVIIGFNVRPDRNAADLAERESVEIRQHSVIYHVTDEIKKAMLGLLEPTFREVRVGSAEVRETFKVPKFGTIAGCMVVEGRVARAGDLQARLLRDHVVVHEGKIGSLRRFKDDVSEVKSGVECGIGFERFNDIKLGDVIEVYMIEKLAPVATV
ncbi:MAG: translation initiation factor IF-2 [Acidobacteria bacterium]|nr:translation initiation factor IF-2 [Acidobacteriota bacterium]